LIGIFVLIQRDSEGYYPICHKMLGTARFTSGRSSPSAFMQQEAA